MNNATTLYEFTVTRGREGVMVVVLWRVVLGGEGGREELDRKRDEEGKPWR